MPYEVTAARKRPQSFEQLAGQEFVAATLARWFGVSDADLPKIAPSIGNFAERDLGFV